VHSSICGYTEDDLDTVFAPELAGLDRERVRVRVREWYNGYSWLGSDKVYNPDIANYEGYYASVFYSYFAALGYEIVVEESSSHGRLDMAVRTGGRVYLFEFKVVEMTPPGSALAQLRERGYADKYRGRGEPIHLVGVEFSRETRNVTAFEAVDA